MAKTMKLKNEIVLIPPNSRSLCCCAYKDKQTTWQPNKARPAGRKGTANKHNPIVLLQIIKIFV